MADHIVGIDLGTTNSEVAALVHGQVQVLASDGEQMMPSVVGLAPDGRLLVGTPARNQYVLYPERTVRSIKRLMGSDQRVALGEQMYTPPEVSALIRTHQALDRPHCAFGVQHVLIPRWRPHQQTSVWGESHHRRHHLLAIAGQDVHVTIYQGRDL